MAEQKKPRTSGAEFWVGKVKNNLDGCTEEERVQIEQKSGQPFNGKLSLIWLLEGRGITPTERNVGVSGDKATAEKFIAQFDAFLKKQQEKGVKIEAAFVKDTIAKCNLPEGARKLVTDKYFKPKVEVVIVAPPVAETFEWAQ